MPRMKILNAFARAKSENTQEIIILTAWLKQHTVSGAWSKTHRNHCKVLFQSQHLKIWLLLVQANLGASFGPHWCLDIVVSRTAIHWSYPDELALNFFMQDRQAGGLNPALPSVWNGISLLICLRQDRYDKYDRTDVTGH